MEQQTLIENLPDQQLQTHLPWEVYVQLLRDGSLPPAIVAQHCQRLRSELNALATLIPYPLVLSQLGSTTTNPISGAYWHGSMIVADLSGFTALSEQLSLLGKQGAEELSAIVNQLFDGLVEEAHRYCGGLLGGGLLKFSGDALTAFFDEAVIGSKHAAYAVSAALTMQERMASFSEIATRAGTFRLRLRVGVHSGRVFAAQVGDAEHIELVVTGRQINRVTLAQEVAAPGEIVISDETLRLLRETETRIHAEERQGGFHRVLALEQLSTLPSMYRWGWEVGPGDLADLRRLASRLESLQPYLPRNLPDRFRSATEDAFGEFRPVTVLFANFYPFSLLLDQLGDDTSRAAMVLNAYYRRVQAVVHRYGGIINKVDLWPYGDRVMALFGAPSAHEDDPLRAVRAALELRQMLPEANAEVAALFEHREWPAGGSSLSIPGSGPPDAGPLLRQRIGINTGTVFAGLVGSARRREYTVMGSAVNLAARLMAAADEDGILLAPSTRRIVDRQVALQELPPLRLKGIAEPVVAANALRLYDLSLYTGSADGSARPPLVGREAEVGMLLRRASSALTGTGQIVALVGDPGTGKTRLVEEMLGRLVFAAAGRVASLPTFYPYTVECQSYEQHTPYAVIRSLLRQMLLLRPNESLLQLRAAIQRRVEELVPDQARFAPLLADLLGLPLEHSPLLDALDSPQRYERACELLEALLRAAAAREPLVLVVDDMHWADASSRELLARLARAAVTMPVLLLLSYRSGMLASEPWRAYEHCVTLELHDLTAELGITLVRGLLRGAPPATLAPLIEKAQGNPFFLEELVRNLLDQGVLLQGEQGWELVVDPATLNLPDSIEGVVIARLDRLDERARELVHVAAVLGRRFPTALLARLCENFMPHLATLEQSDLLVAEQGEYVFRHALVRDVAYESILFARRRDLHRQVALEIESHHDSAWDSRLSLLARHYLLAEEWQPAFRYHLDAGRAAQSRYANSEALALFAQALQIAPQLAAADVATLVELHERSGYSHMQSGQYEAADSSFLAALDLICGQPDAPAASVARLHRQVANLYERRGDFDTALQWIERGRMGFGGAAEAELTRSYLLGAGIYQRQGKYQQSLEWAQLGLEHAGRLGNVRDQAKAYKLLGGTYSLLGDNTAAVQLTERSLQLYTHVQDLQEQAGVHSNLGSIFYDMGRWQKARSHYEAGARLAATIGNLNEQSMIANNLGDVLRSLGDAAAAIEQYQIALEGWKSSPFGSGVVAMNLGAAHLQHGDLELALRQLERSEALYVQAGAEGFLPELLRYRAELALAQGNSVAARKFCARSLEYALEQGARLEEGTTRRVLGETLAHEDDLAGAQAELQASLEALQEAESRYEIARTQLVFADVASRLGTPAAGQIMLHDAVVVLRDLGARYDLKRAQHIALQRGYRW